MATVEAKVESVSEVDADGNEENSDGEDFDQQSYHPDTMILDILCDEGGGLHAEQQKIFY